MKRWFSILLSMFLVLGLCIPTQAKETKTNEEKAALRLVKKMGRYAKKDYDAFKKLFYLTDDKVIEEYFNLDYSLLEADYVETKLLATSGKTSIVDLVFYNVDANKKPTFQAITVMMVKRGKKYYIDERNSSVRRLMRAAEKEGIFPEAYHNPEIDNFIHLDQYNYMYAFKDFYMKDTLYSQPAYLWQKKNGDVEALIWINNGTNKDVTYKSAHLYCQDEVLGEILDVTQDIDVSAKKQSSSTFTLTIPASQIKTKNQPWDYINAYIEVSFHPIGITNT